jgi:CRP-like cAMP-binding protein
VERLPPEVIARLRPLMREERVVAGTTIVREGDPGERFYLVLEGELEVTQAGRGHRGAIGPGDTFGEVALAMGMPRTATVRALTDASLASCDRATFDEVVRPVFSD